MVAPGAMMLMMSAPGMGGVLKKLGMFSGGMKKTGKEVNPMLKKLTGSFKKLGLIAGGVLIALTRASPRLRAEISLLNLRINELVRPVGDELAGAFRILSNFVKGLTDWFKGLSPELQHAITFALALTVALGLLAGVLAVVMLALSPLTLAIAAIVIAIAALSLAWETNWFGIRDIIDAIWVAIGGIIEWGIAVLVSFAVFLGNIFKGPGEALKFFGNLFQELQFLIENAITGIITSVALLVTEVVGGIAGIPAAIGDWFGKIIPSESELLDFGAGIEKAITGIITSIALFVTGIGAEIENVITGIITSVALFVTEIVGGILGIPAAIGDWFSGIIPDRRALMDAAYGIFVWFGNAFTSGIENLQALGSQLIVGFVTSAGTAIGDAVDAFFTFGKDLLNFFIEGLQAALEGAGGYIIGLLKLIADFLGGSLPERGPLQHVDQYGLELGQAYIENIGKGMSTSNITETMNRNLTIGRMEINMPAPVQPSGFLGSLDNTLRRSTSW